ncbi:amidase family protein [Croceibacter atlanticus]|jgi:amidase|uniref:Amidase n=1 Tax=Croceibacter atlanticus (strain ATCC BAA-628 / JCM 21780 / CIP 108009 / IAM 15332 / KCTC 12090 / HTCC2559) TaxID=216432 RepID=A3U7R5_CROAH|nr:amidase family protein [Croceibacter atlanticus]EAP88282.1 amidase [Croceibacter atlanticus HTCC2559]MBW4969579.1 amidase [Croceibacter atlanticus]
MKFTYSFLFLSTFFLIISCKTNSEEKEQEILWTAYDETLELEMQQEHQNSRMQFELIQSKVLDKNEVYQPLNKEVSSFTNERYEALKPLILEQDIPTIQNHIKERSLTYEDLTLFYLKRIYKFELDSTKTLNAIIALNDEVLNEARAKDKDTTTNKHPIFGMPILLKDNVNTKGMATTAGAVALKDNYTTEDAKLVENLKANGALILGKLNLSEWAYYFCDGCPLGYSAIGGQTLNPYGRKAFETGGSSAGSGVATAANYAVATVGSETAGSIISPSSQNSVVGLKPTIGVISGDGIIPISHTLDTAGPMTKNVTDNAIVLDAMTSVNYKSILEENVSLTTKTFGVYKRLLNDSIYKSTVKFIEDSGATIVELDEPELPLDGFLTLLNLEMKDDVPSYLSSYASKDITVTSLEDVMAFNKKDSVLHMPYNQELFDGIIADSTSVEEFEAIKSTLLSNGNAFFQNDMKAHQLDAILSINNYHSAYAAVGFHPCLAMPMGYKDTGEPIALTFIGAPNTERELLKMGLAFETARPIRVLPKNYKD